ncbi:MAG: 3D domain-containing protein [Akkermansiaceae bacterium]
MFYRSLYLTASACIAVLFSSCAGSGPQLLAKTAILPVSTGSVKRDAFPLPAASAAAVAASAGKPRDKHSMPVYAFSDRTRVVRTTAYTCTEDDHLIYGNKNAAGTVLRYSKRVRSAAADWSFYPVGTTFRIKGLPHLYVIDDYGSALQGTGTVDLYKPSKAIMNQWGRRTVELTVVQWGSFSRSAELLSQRTRHNHCAKMLANIIRQQPSLANFAKR